MSRIDDIDLIEKFKHVSKRVLQEHMVKGNKNFDALKNAIDFSFQFGSATRDINNFGNCALVTLI